MTIIDPGVEAAAEGNTVHLHTMLGELVGKARTRLGEPGATPTRVICEMSVTFRPRTDEQQMFMQQLLFAAVIRLAQKEG